VRGGDPLAQRPGLRHARVPLGCQHYGLPIERGVFTRGAAALALPAGRWMRNLFLSAQRGRRAQRAGRRRAGGARVPAQRARPPTATRTEVRIAFDGDAVLFSDEAERVFQRQRAATPSSATSRRTRARRCPRARSSRCWQALHAPAARGLAEAMRIRTALVTARSAPAHERAIRTLMDWQHRGRRGDVPRRTAPRASSCASSSPTSSSTTRLGTANPAAAAGPAGQVLFGVRNPG
jgi:5'-nucleotidase